LSDFNKTLTFSTDFQKYSNTKFYKNPSSGSRVVPCGRTDGKIRRIWESLFAPKSQSLNIL